MKGDNQRRGQRRYPKIGNDCILEVNAFVTGAITIDDDATIMPCSVLTKNVPSNSIVEGVNNIQFKQTKGMLDII